MKLLSAFSRLLTMLAIVGLVMSADVPATAGPMVGAAVSMAMPDGMPPCEDTESECGDMMKSCPSQTVCVAKCPQATLATESSLFPLVANVVDAVRHYLGGRSLAIAPPARPPKA